MENCAEAESYKAIKREKKGVRRMRNRTDFGGKTWKRGRNAVEREAHYKVKIIGLFVDKANKEM